jgi:AraC-like DNA-binding protein
MNMLSIINDFFKLAFSNSIQDEDDIMVQEACRYLAKDYSLKTSIDKLCKNKGWGFEKFRKVFQRKMGISPNKYRIIRRIDTACQMLRDSSRKISEISYELGYSSPYEFSAQFKKYAGVSPSEYIRGKKL